MNAGVGTAHSPQDTKHIRLTNQVSLVLALFSLLAFGDPRMWGTPRLEAVLWLTVLLYAVVPFFASRGWHRFARLWLSLGSLAWIIANGVLMGANT